MCATLIAWNSDERDDVCGEYIIVMRSFSCYLRSTRESNSTGPCCCFLLLLLCCERLEDLVMG